MNNSNVINYRNLCAGFLVFNYRGYEFHYDHEKLILAIFKGEANKRPVSRYRYRNIEHMMDYIVDYIKDVKLILDRKELAKKAKAEFKHSLKVGDVLYSSWGYEQTNIDFYQVVEVKNKSVVVQEIAGSREYTGDMQGKKYPNVNEFVGDRMLKRVSESNSIRLNSYANAWLLDYVENDNGKVYNGKEFTSYY